MRVYFGIPPLVLISLPTALDALGLGQADVVLALLRGPPDLHPHAEALVGRPIDRLPPQPSKPIPAPVKPTGPDTRRVMRVAPNPRLPTTDSFQRYKEFRVGRTVEQLLKRGITRRDIREAVAHQWVELS